MQATKKQLWALFCATKLNTQKMELSKAMASSLLQRVNDGEDITEDMISYGAVSRGGSKPVDKSKFEKIIQEACKRAYEAGQNCIPTPMVVTQPSNPLDDNSPPINTYNVPDGPCGFASVHFKGNTSFGRWAKKEGIAKKDSYRGGLYIWVHEFGQSYERKRAYASEYVKVLKENGIDAYSESRLD